MKENCNLNRINKMVIEGKLPWAFLNLKYQKANTNTNERGFEYKAWSPYFQAVLPPSDPTCLISKIYHVY